MAVAKRIYLTDMVAGIGPKPVRHAAIEDRIRELGLGRADGGQVAKVFSNDVDNFGMAIVWLDNHAPLRALDATDNTFKMMPTGFPLRVKLSSMGAADRNQLDRALTRYGLGAVMDPNGDTWEEAFTKVVRRIQPNFDPDDASSELNES